MCIKFRIYYWPIVTTLWLFCTVITSYLVSVLNGHVYSLFPYISDTGTMPPESCIFGQMLNVGALFTSITMYIRYRVVQLSKHKGSDRIYKNWNNCSNIFGILSCIGMSIVANFQETSVITVHFFGAFLTFAIGGVYCIIQAYLTWLSYSSKFLKYSRILLSSLLIPFYIATTICSMLAFDVFNGNNQFKWNEKDSGYGLHLAGTFSEWIMAILMSLYIISYTAEFKFVKFDEISFVLIHNS